MCSNFTWRLNLMSFTELCKGIQHRHYALERGGTTNQSTEKLEATASETARAAHLLAITTGMTRLTKKKFKKIIQPGHRWGTATENTTVPQIMTSSNPDIQCKQCLPNSNCSLIWGLQDTVHSQQSPVQLWGSFTFQHLCIKGWKDLRRQERRGFWYEQTDLLSRHCVWDSGCQYQNTKYKIHQHM